MRYSSLEVMTDDEGAASLGYESSYPLTASLGRFGTGCYQHIACRCEVSKSPRSPAVTRQLSTTHEEMSWGFCLLASSQTIFG